MQTTCDINSLRKTIAQWRADGKTIAFVPTMGNLHQGHFSLVKKAKTLADIVVVSIFVNPIQFGANEDLDKYPRTLTADSQGLKALNIDLLFTPNVKDIYPKPLDEQALINVPNISTNHCGASRPGHFDGVSTVVAKLFNLVQPDIACFGEKDFQQLQVIRTMVEDLNFPIEIVGVTTKREASGLAMSSRNGYLSQQEKDQAAVLFQSLQQAAESISVGQLSDSEIVQIARQQIATAGLTPDYFNIANRTTLAPATSEDKSLVILVAAFLGNVRLIDNIQTMR